MNTTIKTRDRTTLAVFGDANGEKEALIHSIEKWLFSSAVPWRGERFSVLDISCIGDFQRKFNKPPSTLGVVIIVVNPAEGFGSQAQQAAATAFVFGAQHFVLIVDALSVADCESTFFEIQKRFDSFSNRLKTHSSVVIPLCLRETTDIGDKPHYIPWYQGLTLAEFLKEIGEKASRNQNFIVSVNSFAAPELRHFFQGRILQGGVQTGDKLRVISSGETAVVEEISSVTAETTHQLVTDFISFKLDKPLEIRPGEILSSANTPIEVADHFEVMIIWCGEEEGLVGRVYNVQIGALATEGSITAIKYRLNTSTLAQEACTTLTTGKVYACNIVVNTPVAFSADLNDSQLRSFSLSLSSYPVPLGHGRIQHSLRRANNIHKQALAISRADREALNCHRGKVIWFTGLSGSGKSTIANALEVALFKNGFRTYILDGDNIRHGLNKDLGFTDADRVENIRRLAEVAKLMMDAGLIVMTAFISPFRRERNMAKNLIGADSFVEVYVSTSLEVCEQRDVKGLYKKARSGNLPNLTGVDSPYERPESPDLEIDCAHRSIEDVVAVLLKTVAPENRIASPKKSSR